MASDAQIAFQEALRKLFKEMKTYFMLSHFGFRAISSGFNELFEFIPAMEAKVSDHVWTLEEIAKLAD